MSGVLIASSASWQSRQEAEKDIDERRRGSSESDARPMEEAASACRAEGEGRAREREGKGRIGTAGADRGISNKGQAEPQKPARLKMIFF